MAWTDRPEQAVRRFDDLQGRVRWLAQPLATVRKYADDRGSALAGLLTFQVFLGLLPLLVVALTIFGRILEQSEPIREAVLDSTLVQFPVIGSRIQENLSGLGADGPWLALAIAGLLWTASGIYHSFQLTLNQVWNVPGVDRQGFVSRHLRALVLFVLVFAAAAGTGLLREAIRPPGGPLLLVRVLAIGVGATIAAGLLLAVFRIVVAPTVPLRHLVLAAVLAGVSWEAIQRLGTWIVADRLARAQDLYGAIGLVVVMLFWVNLLARSVVFANEFAVVAHRRLWPRRIAQPPLTEADRRVLVALVENERRRPEETIAVSFTPTGDGPDPAPPRPAVSGSPPAGREAER